MTDLREAREAMVVTQIAARGVRDPRVLSALLEVPRHRFVPAAERAEAHGDHPLPIGRGQTISQPYIVAFMTEMLELRGGAWSSSRSSPAACTTRPSWRRW